MSFSPLRAHVAGRWTRLWALWLGTALALFAQRIETAEKDVQPATIESVQISAEVTGRVAVTTYEFLLRNPNNRAVEGTFLLPLLDGQSVVRFALDVSGSLRDAVPIEKDRGRIVFEEQERRTVDPGLLEQSGGNVYRVRVFPLPANGTRRLAVAVQEDLSPAHDETVYRLNLDFPQRLSLFRLSLNVHTGATLPAQVKTSLALQLPPWRDGQFMEIERTDFDARGVFEIELPKAERPRVMTGAFAGEEYFYAEVPSTPILSSRPAPKVVALLWDSSASGAERDHAKEFALLQAWFAELQNVDVRLVRLREHVTREGNFSVKGGDWQALRKELEATDYDGATSLDGLVDDPRVDAWVLFSDGVFNFGKQEISPKLPLQGVVHTVNASRRADTVWLKASAAHRRGEYVDLLKTDPSKAAFTLQTQSMRVLAIDAEAGAIAQTYPESGTPIQGDYFAIAGILKKKSTTLRILIGNTRENAQPIEFTVTAGDDRTALAPKAWAAAKLQQLVAEAAGNREAIRELGLRFGMVTPQTSLLVLETVDDYVHYRVEPPPELKSEWEARRQAAVVPKRIIDDHRESIVRAFEDRVAWWEQEFPTDKPKPEDASVSDGAAGQGATPSGEPVTLSPFSVASREERRRADERTESARSETAHPDDPTNGNAVGRIVLKPWSPQTGYLERIRKARAERRLAAYLAERQEHAREPGFYLDVAEYFFEVQEPATAVRVLSNLAELELDDPALLRVLGHRLTQADRSDLALPLFERVLSLRPEEPQSRRDLALACAAVGHYQRAVDLLWEIASQPWDSRFPSVELIALIELNSIVATCGQKLDLSKVDPRVLRNLPVDLRIVLTWDANDCDIDLWVDDPNGQTARYDYPLTYQGGLMSPDFTGGYGPEEYVLKKAKTGKYTARINYYGDRRQNAFGPVTAQVRFITGFGTSNQQEKRVTVRLKDKQETLEVGAVEVGAKRAK